MEGSIVFYTYGSTLELYGQQFTAGMLTADLLNLSPDEYRPMSKRMKQVTSLAEEYEQSGSIELWWKLNEELAALPAFEGAHDPLAGAEYWLYGVEQGRDGCRPAGAEAVSCRMEGYR